MKPRPWKTQSSRPIYENPWMHLREDVAEMPDGRTTIYGVVTLGDCVGVVPFVNEDEVLLVRQYCYIEEGLVPVEVPPGETEFLERRILAFDEALRLVLEGEIMDSMSVIAILLAARRRGE